MLFRARAGSLATNSLNCHLNRFGRVGIQCDLCELGDEDSEHILTQCSALVEARGKLPDLPRHHLLGFEGD